jgi:Mitochondrial ribosomal protein L27
LIEGGHFRSVQKLFVDRQPKTSRAANLGPKNSGISLTIISSRRLPRYVQTNAYLFRRKVRSRLVSSIKLMYRRLPLTSKQGHNYYKGNRVGALGRHTRRGKYLIDYNRVRTYVVPKGLHDSKVLYSQIFLIVS